MTRYERTQQLNQRIRVAKKVAIGAAITISLIVVFKFTETPAETDITTNINKELMYQQEMHEGVSVQMDTESEAVEEEDCCYMILDVYENYDDIIVVEMPNGELDAYRINDAPEGDIREVCFRCPNQDDYTTYEVVALR